MPLVKSREKCSVKCIVNGDVESAAWKSDWGADVSTVHARLLLRLTGHVRDDH